MAIIPGQPRPSLSLRDEHGDCAGEASEGVSSCAPSLKSGNQLLPSLQEPRGRKNRPGVCWIACECGQASIGQTGRSITTAFEVRPRGLSAQHGSHRPLRSSFPRVVGEIRFGTFGDFFGNQYLEQRGWDAIKCSLESHLWICKTPGLEEGKAVCSCEEDQGS